MIHLVSAVVEKDLQWFVEQTVVNIVSRGYREGGRLGLAKEFKMAFFKRYFKILSRGYSNICLKFSAFVHLMCSQI